MILLLTSSPCIEGDGHINPDNGFIETLHRVVPRDARVLFVSAAPADAGFSDWCAYSMAGSLESCGLSFAQVQILDDRTAERASELVAECNFAILGGGHVPTQNAFFRRIGLRGLMHGFDGTVMGISAGSMNCADVVYVQPEEPGESVPGFVRTSQGLGLTKTNILPHYQRVKDNVLDGRPLYDDITAADSFGRRLYLLVDGTYVIRENDRETVHGECRLLADGKLELFSRLGEVREIADAS